MASETCIYCGADLVPAGHWGICPKCPTGAKYLASLPQPPNFKPQLLKVGKPAPRPTA